MKEITIDCAAAGNPQELHCLFARALDFPAWYGHNLDALHDQLTSLPEQTHITLLHPDRLPRGFCRVLEDARKENPLLKIILL